MSREKDLIKNTAILSVGKFLPQLTAFITLPILTQYLTKGEYGTYDLVSTLVMLVLPICTLQIQTAAFRFLIECRGDKEKSTIIISNIFFVTVPISCLASIVVQFFFPEQTVIVRILIALYLFLDTINLTIGQATRGLGKNFDYSVASILLSVVNMIGIVLGVWLLKLGFTAVLGAQCLTLLVSCTFMAVRTKLLSYCTVSAINKKSIIEMLRYSWPMIPNNLSNWALKLSDRLVITAALGVEVNAVYAVANKIPNILAIAQSVLVMAWQENASIVAKDEDAAEYYSKMLKTTFKLMFGFTALLIAGTPIIFTLLIKGDYSEAYYQMPVLILAMFFSVMSSYFGGIYIAHKKTLNVGISTAIAAAINLAIDLCCVNVIGIWAGSISTLVAYAFLYFYRMFNSQKFQPFKINYAEQSILLLILLIMLVICFMNNHILNIINFFSGIILFLVFNREIISFAWKKLLKEKKA